MFNYLSVRCDLADATLDAWSDVFVARRAELFAARWRAVAAGHAPALLQQAFAYHGVTGVYWDLLTLPEWLQVVDAVGGAAVAAVCAPLLADRRTWGSGLPDLVLIKPGMV